jgi:hypothetical protein
MKLKYSILMMLYALICKFAHFMKIYCRFTTVPQYNILLLQKIYKKM